LLLFPQLFAVTGGLLELLVFELHDAESVGVGMTFGEVGDSLHPTSTAATSRSALPILIVIPSLAVGALRINGERRESGLS
jgi:hypothetical protein